MFNEKILSERILNSPAPISLKALLREFNVSPAQRREFRRMLHDMESRGVVVRLGGKSYAGPRATKSHIVGRLQVARKGFGFVRPDWSDGAKASFDGDLFIPESEMGIAMNGDMVRAEIIKQEKQGPIGRISGVIEHAHRKMVGQYQQFNAKFGEIVLKNSRLDRRVRVSTPDPALAVKPFDYVEVEILEFTAAPAPLMGKVISRLGKEGDKGIDVLLVLRDLGIVEEFPVEVEQQIKATDFDWENDLKKRKDLRDLPTITIDPKTAKDFDDALSIKKMSGGVWRLYVHIADVTHFLQPNTPLDEEARDRATSVYPVDRVVPMLPEKLSNYLCSLVPHEDRLTVTAMIDLTAKGKIKKAKFFSSVIHSNHRLTYEQVQEYFDKPEEMGESFADVHDSLIMLRDCTRVLRKMRFDRGALDLDIPETKVVFDEAGKAVDIKYYERFEAHKLVEEAMLIANEAVAQYLTEKEAPLLYRIHEIADQERLERIIPILAAFGIRLNSSDGEITPFDIQRALEQAYKLECGHVLRRVVLRALRRAEYDPDNVGHFGLASECYAHFTSPIRRYPDVVVHRQVKALETKGGPLFYPVEGNDLDSLGEHCSTRERRAQEAEWESTEIKAIEFMQQFIGEEFEAFITSVQNFGMFLEMTRYPVEGFIKVQNLHGDYFEIDELGIMLKGKNTGRVYKLGDKITVRLDRCNPMARDMDLSLVNQDETDGQHSVGTRKPRTPKKHSTGGTPSWVKKKKGGKKKRR